MPEILYGRNPVLEALRAGRRIRRLLVAPGLGSDQRLAEILELARRAGVAEEATSRSHLSDVAHTEHHQGLAAYFDGRQLESGSALADLARAGSETWAPLLVCLDGVEDPQNLGALGRSSEALGVTGMVLPRHRTAPLSAAAAKASAGAIEHLRLVRVVNLVQALRELGELGVTVVGLDAATGARPDELDLSCPLALVVGAEGAGMRPLTRRHCDHLVAIPMGGKVQSLNASVAGSLLLYEAARQRGFHFPARA